MLRDSDRKDIEIGPSVETFQNKWLIMTARQRRLNSLGDLHSRKEREAEATEQDRNSKINSKGNEEILSSKVDLTELIELVGSEVKKLCDAINNAPKTRKEVKESSYRLRCYVNHLVFDNESKISATEDEHKMKPTKVDMGIQTDEVGDQTNNKKNIRSW